MKIVKFAYAVSAGGVSTYVLDDGTWDGTEEGTWGLPTVDLSYGENDTVANATEEFRRRGAPAIIANTRID